MNNRNPPIFKRDKEVVAILPVGDELDRMAKQNVPIGTLSAELSFQRFAIYPSVPRYQPLHVDFF
jgi:hypothetical protein